MTHYVYRGPTQTLTFGDESIVLIARRTYDLSSRDKLVKAMVAAKTLVEPPAETKSPTLSKAKSVEA